MDSEPPLTGLTTVEAMQKLYDEIMLALEIHQESHKNLLPGKRRWYHHNNRYSAFHWTSVVLTLICSLLLLVAYAQQDNRDGWLLFEACVMLMLLSANIYFSQWDSEMRNKEIQMKIRRVLARIKACCKEGLWAPCHYISLHSPLSPCVSLQWTLRDARLVNVPAALLARGDVMYVRPGQKVLARCRRVQPADSEKEELILERNSTFEQRSEFQHDNSANMTEPRAQRPAQPQPFVALETPFVDNIRLMLERGSARPPGLLCNERFSSYTLHIERKVLPLVFALLLLVNVLRYCLLHYVGHWTEMFLSCQVQVVLPLTALAYPIIWRLVELYGSSKVLTSFEHTLTKRIDEKQEFESREVLQSKLLETLDRKTVLQNFKKMLRGESDALPRTSSLVQSLGSVTDFCCVDKKGVLSWPNPTAEKVFFFRDNSHVAGREGSISSGGGRGETSADFNQTRSRSFRRPARDFLGDGDVAFEVLDLTQNAKNGYGLQFDDPGWKRYLSSLKPLGLNILLNTCNIDTAEKYTEFADHVTCVAANQETAVPVVNRRCFCELSKAIGFTSQALDIFHLQQVLGMYRQLTTQGSEKERLPKAKSFIKYRMPMPNVFSVVAREANSGISQLFSQGTGDLLLDACSEYWDGSQLRALSNSGRRRIADFYHRTSMASYCTAFAYRPLPQRLGLELQDVYLEVPEYSGRLFDVPQSPALVRSWDARTGEGGEAARSARGYHGSADSVMLGTSLESIHDVEGCFRGQCNQVFIGMISMQYQAKSDLVQLIEDLDTACIRFVHFSKENELRSRVFSEKMGLEAGWNCHISLLNAPFSAPPVGESRTASPSTHDLSRSHSEAGSRPSTFPSHHSTDTLLAAALGRDGAKGKESLGRRRFTAPGSISTEQNQVKFESAEQPIHEYPSSEGVHLDPDESIRMHGDVMVTSRTDLEHVHFRLEEEPLLRKDQKASQGRSRHTTEGSSDLDNWRVASDMPSGLQQSDDTVFTEPQAIKNSSESSEHDTDGGIKTPLMSRDRKSSALSGIDYVTVVSNTNSHNNMIDGSDGDRASDVTGDSDGGGSGDDDEGDDDQRSSFGSYHPSSYITETTDSMAALGLSNRARLPKGIENIRPHIEKVDNVPLLVSLFTDCVPDSTTEMLRIMQEYGEVVCCLGSSANIDNTQIFLQADCTLGVEPLYPQLCQKYPVIERAWVDSGPTPMELSALLNSIPCAVSFSREESFSVLQLIGIARHHCLSLRSTFFLFLVFELFLALLHVTSALCMQPPPLAAHHVMWLAWIVVPLLSLSNMAAELDKDIVKMAQGKNVKHISKHNVREFVLYWVLRYLPSVLVSTVGHGLTLYHLCLLTCRQTAPNANGAAHSSGAAGAVVTVAGDAYPDIGTPSTVGEAITWSGLDDVTGFAANVTNWAGNDEKERHSCECSFWFGNTTSGSLHTWGGWYADHGAGLVLSQNVVAFQIVLYFIFASMCFVHRKQHLWQRSPLSNKPWLICSLVIFCVQIIYFTLDVTRANLERDNAESRHLGHVPSYVIAMTCLWPLVTVAIHELVKRREIKFSVRYQKRARLDFGTKLGMNSPF